ncbi:hypothetical protein G9A89_002635 [Geosiphon pyriformis]|nr:hypothetical protein G9A89_002635 [Geosiphon pyriformis]
MDRLEEKLLLHFRMYNLIVLDCRDRQAAIAACKSEILSGAPDYRTAMDVWLAKPGHVVHPFGYKKTIFDERARRYARGFYDIAEVVDWERTVMVWHLEVRYHEQEVGWISLRNESPAWFIAVESSDHVFECCADAGLRVSILNYVENFWKSEVGEQWYGSKFGLNLADLNSKGFVFKDWFVDLHSIFGSAKLATAKVVELTTSLDGYDFQMEKQGLIRNEDSEIIDQVRRLDKGRSVLVERCGCCIGYGFTKEAFDITYCNFGLRGIFEFNRGGFLRVSC